MPYFIFKVSPARQLDYIDVKEQYRDAREIVRGLRAARTDAADDYRLIFARQRAEAERLLSQPRDERVIGED